MEQALPRPQRVPLFAGWCWPHLLTDSTETWLKSYAFLFASYLTDPICKVREYTWELCIADKLVEPAQLSQAKIFFQAARVACAVAAVFTTIPGIILRSLASFLQKEPYIHLRGTLEEKTRAGNEFTLFSRNYACVAGGYAITDGGVTPWPYRIDAIAQEIKDQNADVVCLSELYDPSACVYLYEQLKDEYAHFYFNMGTKALGPGAGLFVASRYPIHNPHFVPFPVSTLQGRTKWACKGFFRFDLGSKGSTDFARIYTTHLQHSEEPQHPETNIKYITEQHIKDALEQDPEDDVVARAAQMHLIVQDILNNPFKGATLVTGDLNLDDEEMISSPWLHQFSEKGNPFDQAKTWGGDKFCVDLVNGEKGTKKVSEPLNLDHTLVLNESAASFQTYRIPSSFDGKAFKKEALSDHRGLKSEITLWEA